MHILHTFPQLSWLLYSGAFQFLYTNPMCFQNWMDVTEQSGKARLGSCPRAGDGIPLSPEQYTVIKFHHVALPTNANALVRHSVPTKWWMMVYSINAKVTWNALLYAPWLCRCLCNLKLNWKTLLASNLQPQNTNNSLAFVPGLRCIGCTDDAFVHAIRSQWMTWKSAWRQENTWAWKVEKKRGFKFEKLWQLCTEPPIQGRTPHCTHTPFCNCQTLSYFYIGAMCFRRQRWR